MFGTLRYCPQSNATEFIRRSDAALDENGHVYQHSACDSCRSKKVCQLGHLLATRQGTDMRHEQLRCSGEKTGCARCGVTSSECVYSHSRSSRPKESRTRNRTSQGTQPEPSPIGENSLGTSQGFNESLQTDEPFPGSSGPWVNHAAAGIPVPEYALENLQYQYDSNSADPPCVNASCIPEIAGNSSNSFSEDMLYPCFPQGQVVSAYSHGKSHVGFYVTG